MITATNWGMNIIISSTFLSQMKGISPAGAFGFYAAQCAFGWVFCYICYPKAAQMSLKQVQFLFEDGFGVKKAEEWRREHKETLKQRRNEHTNPGA